MDELVDILDENGDYTGKTKLKSEAHKLGLFHPTIHVWLFNRKSQVLIQQRSQQKQMHPGLWDVSVAGHVAAHEHILDAAIRETKEEIGLSVEPTELIKVGVFKAMHTHGSLQDNEFHHCFISELKVPLHQLEIQKEEVADIKLVALTTLAEETWGMANVSKFVPHGTNYYTSIIKAIQNRLRTV